MDEKRKQLGMPLGTAQGRLRKLILFDLVQRLGLDICCRCGKKIISADELSIDHKEPWLHVSVTLFWDLNNIGFSHHACNSNAHRCFHQKYFTRDERATAKRKRNAATKRKTYTPEKRHKKWVTTGH